MTPYPITNPLQRTRGDWTEQASRQGWASTLALELKRIKYRNSLRAAIDRTRQRFRPDRWAHMVDQLARCQQEDRARFPQLYRRRERPGHFEIKQRGDHAAHRQWR